MFQDLQSIINRSATLRECRKRRRRKKNLGKNSIGRVRTMSDYCSSCSLTSSLQSGTRCSTDMTRSERKSWETNRIGELMAYYSSFPSSTRTDIAVLFQVCRSSVDPPRIPRTRYRLVTFERSYSTCRFYDSAHSHVSRSFTKRTTSLCKVGMGQNRWYRDCNVAERTTRAQIDSPCNFFGHFTLSLRLN